MGIGDTLRVVRTPAPIRSHVVDNLGRAILDRRFAPSQRLVERELVELTSVSRTIIREALRELAAERLVTTIPNKGTVVAQISAGQRC
jgi:DNA-binding GntR family transcriptional regulator